MPKIKKSSGHRTKHYRNAPLLEALGNHCQRLRIQRGMSIDRMAKESDQLSTSVIHRLETGQGAVTVSALFRYAETLGIAPKDLLNFEVLANEREVESHKIILPQDPRIKKERFKTLLPLFSLKAAAGYFGSAQTVEPEGWIEIGSRKKLDSKMFVARAVGDSMLPSIHNGDFLVFRAQPGGTRQGKTLLVQYRGPADPDTGGSYAVKRYHSTKRASVDGNWAHQQITLSPTNPKYEPIVLSPKNENDFVVVAEFLFTL